MRLLGNPVNRGRHLLTVRKLTVRKNSAYASCASLPTSVMVKVLVLAGGADESRPTVKEVPHEAHLDGSCGSCTNGSAYGHHRVPRFCRAVQPQADLWLGSGWIQRRL